MEFISAWGGVRLRGGVVCDKGVEWVVTFIEPSDVCAYCYDVALGGALSRVSFV